MNELHNELISGEIFVPKEGQQGLLCSNKKSLSCPSLSYTYIQNEAKVHKAFDILFEAIRRLDNESMYDDT
ncbi:MAG: hypothetical protein JWO03_3494 [Bacteroidetes bacterium]|nr:hypothetical protein [Bacteroidota bacterium]